MAMEIFLKSEAVYIIHFVRRLVNQFFIYDISFNLTVFASNVAFPYQIFFVTCMHFKGPL